MGSVRVRRHPTLYAAPRPGEEAPAVPVPHARVWARLRVAAWGEAWDVHRQLVASRVGVGWSWRPVDLSARPVSPRPPGGAGVPDPREVPDSAVRALVRWLETAVEAVHRSGATGLVSVPGEPLGAFRRRVLAAVVLPVRGAGRRDAATAARALADGIETVEVALSAADRLRVSVGWLVVPEGAMGR